MFDLRFLTLFGIAACLLSTSASSNDLGPPNPIKLGGYLMLDHDYYGPFYNKASEEYVHRSEIRRSKLSIEMTPSVSTQGIAQVKYSREFPDSGELSLGDVYLRYKSKSKVALQLGRMKEPFGLEQQASSSNLIAIERSIISSSFAPNRSSGLQIDYLKKRHTFSMGYYLERKTEHKFALSNINILQYNKEEDTKAVTMRLTYRPYHSNLSTLHIGSSFSKRWLEGKKFQIKESGEVNSADNVVRSARFYADSSQLLQFDLAWLNGPLLLQTELMSNTVKQRDGEQWSYYGGYFQASYHLFGSYKYKKGFFKPKRDSKSGRVELVFRQSKIDLRDHNIGSEAAFSLMGINYYPAPKIKLMANITLPWISGDTVNNNQTGQAYSLRAQLKF